MKKKTEIIGFRVTKGMRKELEAKAADLGINISSLVSLALTAYLKRKASPVEEDGDGVERN